jgi:hypothetical protein
MGIGLNQVLVLQLPLRLKTLVLLSNFHASFLQNARAAQTNVQILNIFSSICPQYNYSNSK